MILTRLILDLDGPPKSPPMSFHQLSSYDEEDEDDDGISDLSSHRRAYRIFQRKDCTWGFILSRLTMLAKTKSLALD
jgi:hypothetical protein